MAGNTGNPRGGKKPAPSRGAKVVNKTATSSKENSEESKLEKLKKMNDDEFGLAYNEIKKKTSSDMEVYDKEKKRRAEEKEKKLYEKQKLSEESLIVKIVSFIMFVGVCCVISNLAMNLVVFQQIPYDQPTIVLVGFQYGLMMLVLLVGVVVTFMPSMDNEFMKFVPSGRWIRAFKASAFLLISSLIVINDRIYFTRKTGCYSFYGSRYYDSSFSGGPSMKAYEILGYIAFGCGVTLTLATSLVASVANTKAKKAP